MLYSEGTVVVSLCAGSASGFVSKCWECENYVSYTIHTDELPSDCFNIAFIGIGGYGSDT